MARPVRVLFFATARTAVGRASVDWPVSPAGVSANELARALVAEYPRLGPVLRGSRWVLNGRYLRGRTGRVRPGDEFAVHPPYGGG
jgi:molybdopterin converting factor small subunit